MNYLIGTCLFLIVFALWGIEWKLEKFINKDKEGEE